VSREDELVREWLVAAGDSAGKGLELVRRLLDRNSALERALVEVTQAYPPEGAKERALALLAGTRVPGAADPP
jgi:hypothetical protein